MRALFRWIVFLFCFPIAGQESWTAGYRLDLRGNYRWSDDERHPLRFPFPPEFLPPGQSQGFLTTPDPGHHVELNTGDLQLDLGRGPWFAARARVRFEGKHKRNPTSSDARWAADELWVRLGPRHEGLERPDGTTFFLQMGKAPRVERQPVRLLESYGLASTSFNRFEDVQILAGGTAGRNLYWRAQVANGNPLFFRDPNALAGDNGTPELRQLPNPQPVYGSGFPILYNAEAEDLFLVTDHLQTGGALGYRWQSDDLRAGYDLLLFHYRRSLAAEVELRGTFYGGDLDLLDGIGGISLPVRGDVKEEYGARLYGEWAGATGIAQFTKQNIAGLQREGWELELGYRWDVAFGPVSSIQPAVRGSGLTNRFRGPRTFVAPSVWWPWTKFDGGVRVGLSRGFDVTAEYTKHNVGSAVKINLREALVTVRWRL